MLDARRDTRLHVDLPIMVTTIFDTTEAMIVDLTDMGAKISGIFVAAGTRLQFDYQGQTVFADCRWSEIDRIGVRFVSQLRDGPLFEALRYAQSSHEMADHIHFPNSGMGTAPRRAAFGRRVNG